jgi:hypothetical protein
MEETLLYVHLAQAHPRPLPPALLQAAANESDPDQRVLQMLGARRGEILARTAQTWGLRRWIARGTSVAQREETERVGLEIL